MGSVRHYLLDSLDESAKTYKNHGSNACDLNYIGLGYSCGFAW